MFANLKLAIENNIERITWAALFKYPLSRGDGNCLGHPIKLVQIFFGEIGEEWHPA